MKYNIGQKAIENANRYKSSIFTANASGLSAKETAAFLRISPSSLYRYSHILNVSWEQNVAEGSGENGEVRTKAVHHFPTKKEAQDITVWRSNKVTWPTIAGRLSPASKPESWYAMVYFRRKKLFTKEQRLVCFNESEETIEAMKQRPPGIIRRLARWIFG